MSSEPDAFVAERRTGIGSTDCAAVAGLSRWKSAFDLWEEKVRELADGKPRHALRRGRFLEDAVLSRYAAEHGVEFVQRNVVIVDGWRRAQLDALTHDSVVEAKTVAGQAFRSGECGTPGTDEVPEDYLVQANWAAALAKRDRVDVTAVVLPEDPDRVLGLSAEEVVEECDRHVYHVPRSDIADVLLDMCSTFWHENVLKGIAPPRLTYEESARMWTPDPKRQVVATMEDARWMAALTIGRLLEKHGKAIVESAKFHLAESMRECGKLVSAQGSVWLEWSRGRRAGYVVEPAITTTMRLGRGWKKASEATLASAVAAQVRAALTSDLQLPMTPTDEDSEL